jgi:hypothetical protein
VSWGPTYTKAKEKHASYVFCMANTKDVYVSTFEYDIASMQYAMKQGKCQLPSTGLVRQYTTSQIYEEFLYAGTMGGEICLFHLYTRLYKGAIPISSNGLMCFVIVDGFLYTGGGDGKLKKVNLQGGSWSLEKEVQLDGKVMSICPSIDKKEVICSTGNGKIYRVLTGDLTYLIHTDAHVNCIYDIAFPINSNDYFATIDDAVPPLDLLFFRATSNSGTPASTRSSSAPSPNPAPAAVPSASATISILSVGGRMVCNR